MTSREGHTTNDPSKFGSGTPGDQGTYSGVGAQPDGGGAGLGSQVESGDGSPQDIAEAGGNPQHRNASGPDLDQATASASKAYDRTEQSSASVKPGSGDRNTASGSSTQDLGK
jgi:hypothetical protein